MSKHDKSDVTKNACKTCKVIVPANASSGTCPTNLEPGESCIAECDEGYTLDGDIHCTDDGEITAATCNPKACKQKHAVANSLQGDCDRELKHGETCSPECVTGHELANSASCLFGQLQQAKCVPKSCKLSGPPNNGESGNCPAILKTGEICQPTCNDGFETVDVTRCDHGDLTHAKCRSPVERRSS